MKLSEIARYWAAKELTLIERSGARVAMRAPFAAPDFTLRVHATRGGSPRLHVAGQSVPLRFVGSTPALAAGTWTRDGAIFSPASISRAAYRSWRSDRTREQHFSAGGRGSSLVEMGLIQRR